MSVTLADHGRALVAEAVGSFWFVAVGAGSVVADQITGGRIGVVGIALAHGLALAVAIWSFGAVSGGHFNPAVTLGLWIARRHPGGRVLTYWAAQIVGALAAGAFLAMAFAHAPAAADATKLGTPAVAQGITPLTAILVELVLTAFLLWAVLGTGVSPSAPWVAGPIVGLAFVAGVLMAWPLTGAAMNPARWIGLAVAAGSFDGWSVFLIGPFAGGALAALSSRSLFAREGERIEPA